MIKLQITIRLTLLWLIVTQVLNAQVWQWSTEIKSQFSSETNEHPRAFLWIPENCKQVKGVVVGMHNMLEEGILEQPNFRKAMSSIGFAQIWITPPLDMLYDPASGIQKSFDEMLFSLAEASGYHELLDAPVVPIGHSACASFPWNFAAWNPHKTLAIVSVKGDAPQTNLTGCSKPNLDWADRHIDGIPGLMIMGEYEWWDARLEPAIEFMKKYPRAPISFLADAGRGHFEASDKLVDYIALFITKAAQFRRADLSNGMLLPVEPESGWLASRWYKDSISSFNAAPFSQFKGDKSKAFWYFDKEMAQLTEKLYSEQRFKKRQYIGFSQDQQLLTFNPNSAAGYNVAFKPHSDGLTFNITAEFVDSTRETKTIRHSRSALKLDRICGPVEKVNDTTFTVRFYKMGLNNIRRTADIWLIASSNCDKEFKSGVQQLNIRIPYPLNEGKKQEILFDSIPDLKYGVKSYKLNAISSIGLPVYYYVLEGPAIIKESELVFTKLPPRSRFPVKITVVAWQYGNLNEPKVQTAVPVKRHFNIIN